MGRTERTQVAIVGAGPAGLMLSHPSGPLGATGEFIDAALRRHHTRTAP